VANPQTVFDKTMRRVDGLLLLDPELHGVAGRPKQHVSDLLRGALVLSVAALDALVLDSVVAAIPRAVRVRLTQRDAHARRSLRLGIDGW
jgi:hypothetical protein